MLGEEVAIKLVVGVTEKGLCSPVAALGYVMRHAFEDCASEAGHVGDLPAVQAISVTVHLIAMAVERGRAWSAGAIKCTVTEIAHVVLADASSGARFDISLPAAA